MGTITVYSPTANVNGEVYLSYGPCYLAEQCITKENYASKNAGKLIQEINIRLAGFGGNVPSEEFTDRTENMIRQFQRDYMNVPETGKICGGLLRAIDEFCSKAEYCFDFSQTACPCPDNGYKAATGYSLCSGYGNNKSDGGGIEHPGMHRSLLFILKALLFYFEKNASVYSLNKIDSGYRCQTNNKYKKRTTTNHMGNALDLHFDKNGERAYSPDDMDAIRKDYFVDLMNAPYFPNESAKFGWSPNLIGLEPKKFPRGKSGATNWVHVDVREFRTYHTAEFYIKNDSDMTPISLLQLAEDLGLSGLSNCINK